MINFLFSRFFLKKKRLPQRFVLILSLILIVPSLSFAQTSLWKVSQGDKHLFLGGTVHVLGAKDYPLPKEFDAAYVLSDKLIFEVDIDEASSPAFQKKMLSAMMYAEGRTLESHLRPKTYAALETYAALIGFPMIQLQSFRPGMAVMMLTMMELQRLGLAETGVDRHFQLRAKQDRKAMGALETIDDQLSFLVHMGEGEEDALILKTISEMKELPALLGDMKTAWRSGDTDALLELSVEPLKSEYPKLYDSLLVQRNRLWMPQIETMLATPETELILVGAAHLVGREGLLQSLVQRGFTVSRY